MENINKIQFEVHELFDHNNVSGFNSNMATALGVEEAIVLYQLDFWINANKKQKRNYRDGYYWTYNTMTEWQEGYFPFFSLSRLRRTFKNLIEAGLVLKANYNKNKMDKRLWYTVDYTKVLEACNKALDEKEILSLKRSTYGKKGALARHYSTNIFSDSEIEDSKKLEENTPVDNVDNLDIQQSEAKSTSEVKNEENTPEPAPLTILPNWQHGENAILSNWQNRSYQVGKIEVSNLATSNTNNNQIDLQNKLSSSSSIGDDLEKNGKSFETLVDLFETEICKLTLGTKKKFKEYFESGIDVDLLYAIIKYISEVGGSSFSYFDRVIKSCIERNIADERAFLDSVDEFRNKRNPRRTKKSKADSPKIAAAVERSGDVEYSYMDDISDNPLNVAGAKDITEEMLSTIKSFVGGAEYKTWFELNKYKKRDQELLILTPNIFTTSVIEKRFLERISEHLLSSGEFEKIIVDVQNDESED